MRAHENVCIFYKKLGTYNPQMTEGHKRKKAHTVYAKEDNGQSVYGKEVRNTLYDSTDRYPLSVQIFSNGDLTNVLHATQKPLPLFVYLIKTYSNEGDLVLDNCSGSATTAEACEITGRNYICIEKEKDIYDVGVERIKNYFEKQKQAC